MTDHPRPNAAVKHWGRRWRVVCFALVALAGVVFWAGCSPEKHYKTLSFFFDGVPDPNNPEISYEESQADEEQANLARRPILYVHKPYADPKGCNACHPGATSGFRARTKFDSNLCLKCHEGVPTAHKVMHGPVAMTLCLYCHEAHESTVPHLLRKETPQLCVGCHVPELLGPEPSAHMDQTRSCLDCHYGHGGEKRFLLRQAMAQPEPSQAGDAPPAEVLP